MAREELSDFGEIYRRYNGIVVRYVASLVHDQPLAEDIAQNTFVAAMQSIESFQGRSAFSTWLVSIARHELYQALRDRNKEIDLTLEELDARIVNKSVEAYEDDPSSYGSPEYAIANEARRAVEQVKEPQRTILLMRIIDDKPYEEIAQAIGRSPSYCRVNFLRARKRIREEFYHER